MTLALSKTHLLLRAKGFTVIIRLLEGEYIKYRQLLPPSYAISTRVSRGELADCIDRASLMAREGKNNLLRFSIRQDKLSITSNSEMGDVYEEMDVETTGSDIDIAFNVRYITDAVKSIDEEQFLIKLNSNISPASWSPPRARTSSTWCCRCARRDKKTANPWGKGGVRLSPFSHGGGTTCASQS